MRSAGGIGERRGIKPNFLTSDQLSASQIEQIGTWDNAHHELAGDFVLRERKTLYDNHADSASSEERIATLQIEQTSNSSGTMFALTLTEEPGGVEMFETYLAFAYNDEEFISFCQLRTATNEVTLARPRRFNAYCPAILREIIESGQWLSGTQFVSTTSSEVIGKEGGSAFLEELWDQNRTLPVVAISSYDDEDALFPDIAATMAAELVGMATVVNIDANASWHLSGEKGREWSCYNGAIRLYWPIRDQQEVPFVHPLWTQSRLMSGTDDPEYAARRIRRQVRRRIFNRSVLRREPSFIRHIREEYVTDQFAQAREKGEFEELSYSYERDAKKAIEEKEEAERQLSETEIQLVIERERVDKIQKEKEDLEWQIKMLRNEFIEKRKDSSLLEGDEIEDDVITPVATVAEAVDRARSQFDYLVFGPDVEKGVKSLNFSAGPPDLIFRYLRVLNDAAVYLSRGDTQDGYQYQQIFLDNNVKMSGESGNLSKKSRPARTWKDERGQPRLFTNHLKPNDHTPPDRCVRIYFDPINIDGGKKIFVAWVGRHPDK